MDAAYMDGEISMEKGLPLAHPWKLGAVSSITYKQISQMEQLSHWTASRHLIISQTRIDGILWLMTMTVTHSTQIYNWIKICDKKEQW